MTPQQRQFTRLILNRCVSCGFNSSYPIKPIAEEMGVAPEEIYDDNTETGFMFKYSDHGDIGMFSFRGGYVSADYCMLSMMEAWSMEPIAKKL